MLEVMQRRGDLLAKIASQRGQVAQIGARWEAPLAFTDKCLAATRFLRSRPIFTASVAALFVVRRRGFMGLARSGWLAWKWYRYFIVFSAKLSSKISQNS
jgi:hypothetical protein